MWFNRTPSSKSRRRIPSPRARGTATDHAFTAWRCGERRLRVFGRGGPNVDGFRAAFARTMGELIFIGLGLDDEKGVTLRGLDEAQSSDLVFAERYTSGLSDTSLDAIEKLVGKGVHRLTRKEVEDGEVILAAAVRGKVAFLIPGDPMAATTHVDLRLRAVSAKIPTRIVHGVSILTAAAGALGLQAYKFGRTTTVPFPAAGFGPTSPLEAILENRRAGLHSLVLLDLREDGSFLTPQDAIALLLRMAVKMGTPDFGPETLACVLSRVGSPEVRATGGAPRAAPDRDLGPPLHWIVVPGRPPFLEKEAPIIFAASAHRPSPIRLCCS